MFIKYPHNVHVHLNTILTHVQQMYGQIHNYLVYQIF